MLVLSRKHGEQIELSLNGQLVTVAVVRIESGRVRIGIEAPLHVAVRRKELGSPLTPDSLIQAGT